MFRLPFAFIVTGLVGFALFQLLSLADWSLWLVELAREPRFPTGWSRAHLFVLGWATMIAMGAVYQLVPVILQNHPLFSRKLGYIHYAVFTTGVAGLIIGFQQMRVAWIGAGATIAFVGVVLFAINIGATLIRAGKWNSITISTASAVSYLVLAGMVGMLMGLNFAFEWWGEWHDRLLGAHLWLGAAGWFGFLITGFSYKLMPMFMLSHGYRDNLPKWIILLAHLGIVGGACSFLLDADWLKVAALVIVVADLQLYSLHLSRIDRLRHKHPGAGVRAAQFISIALAAVGTLVVLLLPVMPDLMLSSAMNVILGWVYLWGWVGLTVLAYLSKIVPFLWWTHKYGGKIGKMKTPTMADMMDDHTIRFWLTAIVASLFVMLAGIGWNLPAVIMTGGTLLSATSLVYVGQIARVFAK